MFRGITKNLLFFNHKFEEEENTWLLSKMNSKEAEFILEFSRYLVQNFYNPSQISILTLYTGQLLLIKKLKYNYKDLKDVVLSTVDNYQGEENDIIILSLVRSNKKNAIGFLKVSNRVCVALSRAKQGFFIFGNAECLRGSFYSNQIDHFNKNITSKNNLWIKVLQLFKNNNNINKFLPLNCSSHGNIFQAKTKNDINYFIKNGCGEKCNVRLNCGHVCKQNCHPFICSIDDTNGHKDTKCIKK